MFPFPTLAIPGTTYVCTAAQCFRCSKWLGVIIDPGNMRLLSESPHFETPEDAWAACREVVRINAQAQGRWSRGGSA